MKAEHLPLASSARSRRLSSETIKMSEMLTHNEHEKNGKKNGSDNEDDDEASFFS